MISYKVATTAVFLVGAVACYVIQDNYVAYMQEIQRYKSDIVACTKQLNSAVFEVNQHTSTEQEALGLREQLEFANRRLKDVEDRNQELERRLVNGK